MRMSSPRPTQLSSSYATLLVLCSDSEPTVINLDTGPCDTVRVAGAARIGAAEIIGSRRP